MRAGLLEQGAVLFLRLLKGLASFLPLGLMSEWFSLNPIKPKRVFSGKHHAPMDFFPDRNLPFGMLLRALQAAHTNDKKNHTIRMNHLS